LPAKNDREKCHHAEIPMHFRMATNALLTVRLLPCLTCPPAWLIPSTPKQRRACGQSPHPLACLFQGHGHGSIFPTRRLYACLAQLVGFAWMSCNSTPVGFFRTNTKKSPPAVLKKDRHNPLAHSLDRLHVMDNYRTIAFRVSRFAIPKRKCGRRGKNCTGGRATAR
jgi:hypothetical protein